MQTDGHADDTPLEGLKYQTDSTLQDTDSLSISFTFIVDILGPEEQVFVTDETKLSSILVSIPDQKLSTWEMTINSG